MEPGAVRIEELLAHASWVQELAARLVRDPASADDLTQEVWARALRSPPRERTNLRGWLAATVRTTALALRRGQSRRSEHEQRAFVEREEPSPEEVLERAQLHRRLVEEVLALPEAQRALVLGHWFEGKSIVAIAQRLGVTPRIARARLDEAHEELRRRLDESSGGRSAWLGAFGAWTASQAPASAGTTIAAGGLVMATKWKVSLACLAALLVWMSWRRLEPTPALETAPVTAAAGVDARLDSPPTSGRTAVSPPAPASSGLLDAFLDVEVRDKFTRKPLEGVALFVGFERGQQEKLSKLTQAELDELRKKYSTPADGKGTLALPSGTQVTLFATPAQAGIAGMAQDLDPLAPGEHRKIALDLNVAPDMHVFVRVLSREDRRPIAGATASLNLRPPFQSDVADRSKIPPFVTEDAATSDEQGLLDFWAGSWRLMAMRVHAPGHAPAFAFPGGQSSAAEPLEILLERGAMVPLHVVDLAGMPVEGVRIELGGSWGPLAQPYGSAPPYGVPGPSASWSGLTRADGRCVIEELPSGMTLRPKLSKPGVNARGTPDPFTLVPGQNPEILWRFGASCTLSGRVLDAENKPVSGLELWLRCQADNTQGAKSRGRNYFFEQYSHSISASTVSDEAGHYRFDSVAPGRAWVGPGSHPASGSPVPGAVAPIADEVEIPDTVQAVEHDIRVEPALYVGGHALDPHGKPVRTFVRLRVPGGNFAWIGQSGNDGAFLAGPLGEGAYVLVADPPLMGSLAVSEELAVHAGDMDVSVPLRAGAALEATFVDDESGDTCNANLVLSLRGGTSIGPYPNHSEDPTHYSCSSILPGLYDVMARTRDGRVGLERGIDIQPTATTDLVVRLKPAAKLRARLEGKSPWGSLIVHNGEAEVVRNAVTRGGLFEGWVPPGHLVIEFTPILSEKPQRREIDIQAGEEKDLLFRDED